MEGNVAIERPDNGAAGPIETGEKIATVGDVVKAKEKKLAAKPRINKKQGSTKPRTNRKSTSADTKKKPAAKKRAPAKPKTLLPPKHLKTQSDWKSYFESVVIGKLIEYMEKKPDKITVTMAIVLRAIANRILKLTEAFPTNYNDWLEYFSTMTPEETEAFVSDHSGVLGNEGRAAGMRWVAIADNPTMIDKIVNSRLEQRKTEELGDIMAASKSGDRVQLFEAIRDNIAYKISENAGARDMTVLIKQLNEVTLTLDELYRARGDKGDGNSSVRKLLLKARKRAQRPKSSQAAQTIDDAEDDDDEDDQ
jgi:hypothetical protein